VPIPASPLHLGDHGVIVADLHRTFESLNRTIDQGERDRRIFGPVTEALLREYQTQSALPATGVFDADTRTAVEHQLSDIAPFSVYGRLTDANGAPIARATIFAVDVDLRRSQVLREEKTMTDSEGDFEVRYAASRFTRADKHGADLVVRAVLDDQLLAESPVLFNAPPEVRIDLVSTTFRGPSEYEQLSRELEPLLDGISPGELVETDVAFLAGETGRDGERWRAFVQAQHLAIASAPREPGIPAEAFYGWLRGGMPSEWDALRAAPISTLRASLVGALDGNVIPAAIRDRLDEILGRVPSAARTQLATLLGGSTLPPDRLTTVLAHVDGVAAVSDELLAQLVADQTIASHEAEQLGLTVSLHRLAGGEPAIVETMLKTEFPSVTTGRLQHARDLATLDPDDWHRALEAAGAPVPEGMSRATHARSLALDAAGAYPEDAFRQRVGRVPGELDRNVERLRALVDSNKDVFSRELDERDLAKLPDRDRDGVHEAHRVVRGLANMHPGLRLHEVFSKPGGKAAKIAAERIGWVSGVLERNPTVPFLDLDYLPDSLELAAVDFGTLPDDAKKLVVANLKAHRRIHAVTGNAIPAAEVMSVGFHSASAIAVIPTAELAAVSGLPAHEAAAYHDMALELANAAALSWFGIHDLARDHATTRVRVIPSRQEFFRPLEGFAQLVNDQPWCECEHCQSVLSPAAYFVDLLSYIERNILSGSFQGQAGHLLHLQQRRPDLWDLPLTCANTTDYVPHLDVVNEILEGYLANAANLANAAAVYPHLASQTGSFQQPFTLPLERLNALLGHFGLAHHDIAAAMRSGEAVQIRARLQLSVVEYGSIITEGHTDPGLLRKLFELGGTVTAPDAVLAPLEMAAVIRATGLDHAAAEAALTSKFVNMDGSNQAAIEVVLGKKSEQDLQNNAELVSRLTLRRLDRLHRFVRLWRRLPWTIAELDHALDRIAVAGAAGLPAGGAVVATLVQATLGKICDLLEVNAAWSLPVEELIALSDGFAEHGLREPTSLFDRLFNQPAFLGHDVTWPLATGRFTHPSWDGRHAPGSDAVPVGVSVPPNNTLARLLAALQLSDAELVELVAGLQALPAIDHRAATALADESIALSRESLSTLYRHARLRRLLGCKVRELLQLLALAPSANGSIAELGDVRRVVELARWQRTSGFNLDEISSLVRVADPVDPAGTALATQIVAAVQLERSLEFADTIFTQIGLTEAQSRALVLAHLSTTPADTKPIEAHPDGTSYRLRAGTTTPVTLPAAIAIDPSALNALLGKYDAIRVLDVALGNALRLSPDVVEQLRGLADPLDAGAVAAITRVLQGKGTAAELALGLARLTRLATAALKFQALFKSPAFDLENLTFVRDHAAVFFGPAATPAPAARVITVQVIRNVAAYVALATATDAGFTTASGPADREAIQTVVAGLGGGSTPSDAALARTLRTDEARIAALRPHLQNLPSNPFEALSAIARCLQLAKQLGVSGETLKLLAADSATFDALSRAADDIFGAFRARYPDEKTFADKIEAYEDALRTRKRDALVDYLVTGWRVPFADANKLSEYFLIDVMVQGCARTSRVVSATSSLQLYVHRVLMNLENSADWTGQAGVHARFVAAHPDTATAKRLEWQWRQHYRVWEANRKVFLYPENYLEPELRDDKTELFEELEDSLLLQDISPSNVHDAYSRYLTGFDQLARLKIAGAFYDAAKQQLHLFGVTQDDAPAYYYRYVDEHGSTAAKPVPPRYSAWQKLDLQIPVRKVSPILFEGRLYLFWVESATRPVNMFTGGRNDFTGYRHTVRIKYSTLRLDGTWASPQLINFVTSGAAGEALIVEDPLDDARKRELTATQTRLEGELLELQGNEQGLKKPAEDADKAASDATKRRSDMQDILRAPANVFEEIAIAPALLAGVSRQDALDALRWPIWLAWKILIGEEHGYYEKARQAHDNSTAATNARETKQREIAEIKAAIAHLEVFVRWDRSFRDHKDALDSYKPGGWEWDRVYPEVHGGRIKITLVPRNTSFVFPDGSDGIPATRPEDAGTNPKPCDFDPNPGLLRETLDTTMEHSYARTSWSNGHVHTTPQSGGGTWTYLGQRFYRASFWLSRPLLTGNMVASAPPLSDVQSVNGEPESMIIESQGDSVWMRKGKLAYAGIRLGTGLTATLTRKLWDGASSLLDATFQANLVEVRSSISPVAGQGEVGRDNPFHPENPSVTYFRETFFHIPFLIANHLNSQQAFADTQRWYHYIFDPTAEDGQPWRHREFRTPSPVTTSLYQMLTDRDALEAYRAHPFSPHAIARTRMSAYQKSIVMKYVDNLLDWGDTLFGQFTMESINEASMLYMMAQDILGPRPAMLGSCGEGKVTPKTYRTIRSGLTDVSDFLVELEVPQPVAPLGKGPRRGAKLVIDAVERSTPSIASQPTIQPRTMAVGSSIAAPPPGGPPRSTGGVGTGSVPAQTPLALRDNRAGGGRLWTSDGGTALAVVRGGGSPGSGVSTLLGADPEPPRIPASRGGATDFFEPRNGVAGGHVGVRGGDTISTFGALAGKHDVAPLDVTYDLHGRDPVVHLERDPRETRFEVDPVDLVPPKNAVFCIPPNKDLLAYWSRVEDRLFKVRNCMDIAGVRRRIDLFAPEIDPRLLVRMTAEGLSLDDVLGSTSGNLPPYRFTYLIDKAKQHAATLQSFGAQLLSALEKRDGEELAHLRAVHEQNLLTMRTAQAQLEINAAEDTLEGLRRQQAAVEYRRDHFTSLREVGQIAQERKQQDLQHEASSYRTAAGIAQVVASILTVIPDIGAWTAMKFGGSQLGAAGRAVGEGLNAVAAFHEMSAARAGVEASNQRRDEEWHHQVETARHELNQLDKSITAAEIRRDIAVHALAVHEQTVAQTEELFEFFRDKFSSVDRYRLLSKELRRLYRLAFNSALSIAKLTEQAYRAERTGDDTLLSGNYWDADNAGLLAGERLLIDLQRFERQFIEGNYRQLEVDQSFSLAQFAPESLAALRSTGECSFKIPEWFFDLSYPGHYRRRLKAVRVSIPCVTGPYANIGATLRLESSKIRLNPPADDQQALGDPDPVPLRHTVSIATSKAQNDSGVFEFSFRDERYMPFEGAGAISDWQVALPRTIRAFDYATISDVILHLAYTADHDEGLRQRWDGVAEELLELLRAEGDPPLARLFSLRHEFPDVFHRLVTSAPGTPIGFTIEARHFPSFVAHLALEAATASLCVISPLSGLQGATLAIGKVTPPPQLLKEVDAPAVASRGSVMKEFECGSVLQTALAPVGIPEDLLGDYVIRLVTPGPLATGAGAVEPRNLHDVVLSVGYRLGASDDFK